MKNTYIQYGVPSDWAKAYEELRIPASTFKSTSKENLIDKYRIPENQVDFVKNCLVRDAIDEKVMQELLGNNAFTCCLCYGQKSDAYIIHHIIEYSVSKDNTYDNLAVVCPNDHDLAHRKGISLTAKITEEQIKYAKIRWEEDVKKSKEKKIRIKLKINSANNWKDSNPFKELKSYSEIDEDFFFGRKQEIDELERTISKYNIVGLFGESGTGKTSLVNAGLIPKLRDEAVFITSVRCLDEPIRRTREALIKMLKENKMLSSSIDEIATTDSFPHLVIQLNEFVAKENVKLCVIIDQFEELFTRAPENEREQLARGISEALINTPVNGKVYFLLSLREDYIGDLWDWAHKHNLENAWIHQYRIKRLSDKRAHEVIVEPLDLIGIKVDEEFIHHLIEELKVIGSGAIYPPYLQISCSMLFEEYKKQNEELNPTIVFGRGLYNGLNNAASIIAEYLSESVLEGLTAEEKNNAQNILDVLTGPEGLRTFLSIEEVSRYTGVDVSSAGHVVEHLVKKKIVLPIMENDTVKGYELVHDFLSKKFFEKLSPEAKKTKTTIDILRIAYRDWKAHGVLASQDRLEILAKNIKQLSLVEEEWLFLVKSSFRVYSWFFGNEWVKIVEKESLAKICISLLNDEQEKIVENALRTLAQIQHKDCVSILKGVIESNQYSDGIKSAAIGAFYFDVHDFEIIETLRKIIKEEANPKLRKEAIYAFAANVKYSSKMDNSIIDKEVEVIFDVLNDPQTAVRKQAAEVLGYPLVSKKSVSKLMKRLEMEKSYSSRKAIISSLGKFLRKGESINVISSLMQRIVSNENEDPRVIKEAKDVLLMGYDGSNE